MAILQFFVIREPAFEKGNLRASYRAVDGNSFNQSDQRID
jgi:hypothetical protein